MPAECGTAKLNSQGKLEVYLILLVSFLAAVDLEIIYITPNYYRSL